MADENQERKLKRKSGFVCQDITRHTTDKGDCVKVNIIHHWKGEPRFDQIIMFKGKDVSTAKLDALEKMQKGTYLSFFGYSYPVKDEQGEEVKRKDGSTVFEFSAIGGFKFDEKEQEEARKNDKIQKEAKPEAEAEAEADDSGMGMS